MQAPDVQEVGLSDAAHAPGKCQSGWSDSKTDHVGQRIELLAEFAARARGTGHKTVEGIEQDRQADGLGGVIQIRAAALERGHHGIKAAQHVGHGHGTGQKIDAAAELDIGSPGTGKTEFVLFEVAHFHRARTLAPPATCWPGRTRISTPAGSQISIREPKRIIPTRSPRITESPTDFQQTMRRATHPAICLKTTSP